MFLVILRHATETKFRYLAKDLKSTTFDRDRAATFIARDEALAAAQRVVQGDHIQEVKVVQQ